MESRINLSTLEEIKQTIKYADHNIKITGYDVAIRSYLSAINKIQTLSENERNDPLYQRLALYCEFNIIRSQYYAGAIWLNETIIQSINELIAKFPLADSAEDDMHTFMHEKYKISKEVKERLIPITETTIAISKYNYAFARYKLLRQTTKRQQTLLPIDLNNPIEKIKEVENAIVLLNESFNSLEPLLKNNILVYLPSHGRFLSKLELKNAYDLFASLYEMYADYHVDQSNKTTLREERNYGQAEAAKYYKIAIDHIKANGLSTSDNLYFSYFERLNYLGNDALEHREYKNALTCFKSILIFIENENSSFTNSPDTAWYKTNAIEKIQFISPLIHKTQDKGKEKEKEVEDKEEKIQSLHHNYSTRGKTPKEIWKETYKTHPDTCEETNHKRKWPQSTINQDSFKRNKLDTPSSLFLNSLQINAKRIALFRNEVKAIIDNSNDVTKHGLTLFCIAEHEHSIMFKENSSTNKDNIRKIEIISDIYELATTFTTSDHPKSKELASQLNTFKKETRIARKNDRLSNITDQQNLFWEYIDKYLKIIGSHHSNFDDLDIKLSALLSDIKQALDKPIAQIILK